MEGSPKALIRINDPSRLIEIDDAPRTIIYLAVDWSLQGLDGQKKFLRFVESFVIEVPDLEISFFILEEDQDFVRSWLGLKQGQKRDFVIGEGSVAWFASGKLVGWALTALRTDLRAATTQAFGI